MAFLKAARCNLHIRMCTERWRIQKGKVIAPRIPSCHADLKPPAQFVYMRYSIGEDLLLQRMLAAASSRASTVFETSS